MLCCFNLIISFFLAGSEELTYTLSEAVEKIGFGRFQIKILLMVGFFTVSTKIIIPREARPKASRSGVYNSVPKSSRECNSRVAVTVIFIYLFIYLFVCGNHG